MNHPSTNASAKVHLFLPREPRLRVYPPNIGAVACRSIAGAIAPIMPVTIAVTAMVMAIPFTTIPTVAPIIPMASIVSTIIAVIPIIPSIIRRSITVAVIPISIVVIIERRTATEANQQRKWNQISFHLSSPPSITPMARKEEDSNGVLNQRWISLALHRHLMRTVAVWRHFAPIRHLAPIRSACAPD